MGESFATGRQAHMAALPLPASGWDLSVATIPSNKGSDIPPKASASGTRKEVD